MCSSDLSNGENIGLNLIYFVGFVLVVQVFLGGVLSGMKAAVVFPSWPDMNGSYFPSIIFDIKQWNLDNFNNYDKNEFMPALIHFLHRNTAYLLFFSGSYMAIQLMRREGDSIIKYVGIAFFCGMVGAVATSLFGSGGGGLPAETAFATVPECLAVSLSSFIPGGSPMNLMEPRAPMSDSTSSIAS